MPLLIKIEDLVSFSKATDDERELLRTKGNVDQLNAYNFILAAENRGFRQAVELFAKGITKPINNVNKNKNEDQEA